MEPTRSDCRRCIGVSDVAWPTRGPRSISLYASGFPDGIPAEKSSKIALARRFPGQQPSGYPRQRQPLLTLEGYAPDPEFSLKVTTACNA